MIADMLNSIVTELVIRGTKLNISLVFITQSCLKVPKDVRLNKKDVRENFNKLHIMTHQTLTLKTL